MLDLLFDRMKDKILVSEIETVVQKVRNTTICILQELCVVSVIEKPP